MTGGLLNRKLPHHPTDVSPTFRFLGGDGQGPAPQPVHGRSRDPAFGYQRTAACHSKDKGYQKSDKEERLRDRPSCLLLAKFPESLHCSPPEGRFPAPRLWALSMPDAVLAELLR